MGRISAQGFACFLILGVVLGSCGFFDSKYKNSGYKNAGSVNDGDLSGNVFGSDRSSGAFIDDSTGSGDYGSGRETVGASSGGGTGAGSEANSGGSGGGLGEADGHDDPNCDSELEDRIEAALMGKLKAPTMDPTQELSPSDLMNVSSSSCTEIKAKAGCFLNTECGVSGVSLGRIKEELTDIKIEICRETTNECDNPERNRSGERVWKYGSDQRSCYDRVIDLENCGRFSYN